MAVALAATALGPVATPEYLGSKKAERYSLAPASPSNPTAGGGIGSGSATLQTGSSDYSGAISVVVTGGLGAGAILLTFNLGNTADSANYRVNITPANALAAELAATQQPNTTAIGTSS